MEGDDTVRKLGWRDLGPDSETLLYEPVLTNLTLEQLSTEKRMRVDWMSTTSLKPITRGNGSEEGFKPL
jgi:hypothetical protein